jgi:hypothetical protein
MYPDIKQFFKNYEQRFNEALKGHEDIDGTVNSFADCFLEASPKGVICGNNDENFRKNIPKGNAFYKNIGTRLMKIKNIEVTQLNDIHFMAKVFWHSEYEKQDKTQLSIDFDIIYLLQYRDVQLKIFAYITGDEQAELQKHGLV